MQRSDRSPDDYLSALPQPQGADIRTLDASIAEVMKGHDRYLIEGKFWGGSDQEIIAYGHYVYKNRSRKTVEWHIAGLALQKDSISVYVNAVEGDTYLTEAYGKKLGKVKTGKSVVSFRKLEDVNLELLLEMIARARDIMTGAEPGS